MKRIFVYLIVFAILCFLSNSLIDYKLKRQIELESPYCLSFASAGANLLELRMECWAKIKINPTFEDMDRAIIKHLAHLNLSCDPQKIHHKQENNIFTSIYQTRNNGFEYRLGIRAGPGKESIQWFYIYSYGRSPVVWAQLMEKLQKENTVWFMTFSGEIPSRTDPGTRRVLARVMINHLENEIIDLQENGDELFVECRDRKTFTVNNLYLSCPLESSSTKIKLLVINDNKQDESIILPEEVKTAHWR